MLIKAGSTRNSGVKLPGSVFDDTLGSGEGAALKVGLAAPEAGGAVIGVWNARANKSTTADVLRRRDVADALGLLENRVPHEQSLAVFFGDKQELLTVRDFDYTVEVQKASLESEALAALRLPGETCNTVTVSPLLEILGMEFAVLGLVDKYAGLCAVHSTEEGRVVHEIAEDIDGRRLRLYSIRLDAAGLLGLAIYGSSPFDDLHFYIEQERVEPKAKYLEVKTAGEGERLVFLDMVKFIHDKKLAAKVASTEPARSNSWHVSFGRH